MLTEAGSQDTESEKKDAEQPKSAAGGGEDYQTAAKKLAEKYKIKIYAGQTGHLSGADMDADEYMRRMYMMGQGRNPVRLRQIVFSVDELQTDPNVSPAFLDWQRPKVLENIGPVRDLLAEIMLLVRVTKAQKTSAPESIDSILDTRSLMLDDDRDSSIEHPVSAERRPVERTVKQEVADDLKKLAVINNGLVKSKAEEFIAMAEKDGWESTLDKFNKLYPRPGRGEQPSANSAAAEPNQNESDPNSVVLSSDTAKDEVFKVESLSNLRRLPRKTRAILETQSEGGMGEQMYVQEVQKWLSASGVEIQGRFVDQLYSLVPKGSSVAEGLPLLMEFKPEMSFYVIKDILVKRLGLAEYEKLRAAKFFREDQIQSQSMAPVHFNPENILKRMKFRRANQQNETKAESEGAS